MRSPAWPRILSEQLAPLPEPLAVLLRPGEPCAPAAVAGLAARALLDLPPVARSAWPPWLAPHQIPAAERLTSLLTRHGGAVLADAVGLGKSFVALGVAHSLAVPCTLVVPAVLVPQWRALLRRVSVDAGIITHESLSVGAYRPVPPITARYRLVVVDEAHRFRNPETRRYEALAKLVVGARVLLVTATPVHNRPGDVVSLLRLFLRDDALTALGLPSLRRAVRSEAGAATIRHTAIRLVVARSRERVRHGYEGGPVPLVFPARTRARTLRPSTLPFPLLDACMTRVRRLRAAGDAGALARLGLLRRLASSVPAFRASLERYDAFLRIATEARAHGRAFGRREFEALFPRGESPDVQLALLPLLLEQGATRFAESDLDEITALRSLLRSPIDPKADALERLLADAPGRTIVFAEARETVRYLLRRLRTRHRAAAVFGDSGLVASGAVPRSDVLRAFAPDALGAPPPPGALTTDVLVATDLASEGLNLQDACRVIHYDLPWSPARLAQRVGRVDRLGSPHAAVETVAFLPAEQLENALALERRLAAKAVVQRAAGAAQVEALGGPVGDGGPLDWCDRLSVIARAAPDLVAPGAWATVTGTQAAVALVVRLGTLTEALVVRSDGVRADPEEATGLLESASGARERPAARAVLERAIERAAPLIRSRLAALADARWRASDRDRLARRLIPWALTAARRAARRGDLAELEALDRLVSRLTSGLTAGEELLLADLVSRREPLTIRKLKAWHEGLPPITDSGEPPTAELVAALVVEA